MSLQQIQEKVAFSAYISENVDRQIGIHHVFIYDSIYFNHGNAYNKFTGIFTVPTTGIFAILWTVAAEGVKGSGTEYGEVNTELVVNSVPRAQIHADTETLYDDDEATGFVILQLNIGDAVYVRSAGAVVQGTLQQRYHQEWTFSSWQIV